MTGTRLPIRLKSFSRLDRANDRYSAVPQISVISAIVVTILVLTGLSGVALAQQRRLLGIGDARVYVTESGYGRPGGIVIANVHENESTSLMVGKEVAQQIGARFVELNHSRDRCVTFNYYGVTRTFDPNRIFNFDAIVKFREGDPAKDPCMNPRAMPNRGVTAEGLRPRSEVLSREIYCFGMRVIHDLLEQGEDGIVVVHNTLPGMTTIRKIATGLSHNKAHYMDVNRTYINDSQPDQNYFWVTNAGIARILVGMGYSVVLQESYSPEIDDGSMSMFAAFHNIPYITVEAGIGDSAAQREMVHVAVNTLLRNRNMFGARRSVNFPNYCRYS